MGTTADKLLYLSETKELIRQAIINKGVDVDTLDPFRIYPDKIEQIEGGGGGGNEWGNLSEELYEIQEGNNPWDDLISNLLEITSVTEVPYV